MGDRAAFVALRGVVENATSLRDVELLLPDTTDEDKISQCQELLKAWLQNKEWSQCAPEHVQAEIVTLIRLHPKCDGKLINATLIADLFECEGFKAPINENILRLISCVLSKEDQAFLPIYLSRNIKKWLERWLPAAQNFTEGSSSGPRPQGALSDTDEVSIRPFHLLHNLEWWTATYNRLWAESNPFPGELDLLLKYGLELYSENNQQLFLQDLPSCVQLYNTLPPQILNHLAMAARATACVLEPPEVFTTLYPKGDRMDHVAQCSIHPWLRRVYRSMILAVMDSLDRSTGIADEDSTHLNLYLSGRREITIVDLMRQDYKAWAFFLYWYVHQRQAMEKLSEDLSQQELEEWNKLSDYFEMGKSLFSKALARIESGDASISLVNQSALSHWNCWDAIGLTNGQEIIEKTAEEITLTKDKLGRYQLIAKKFLSDDMVLEELLCSVEKNWDKFTLIQMREVFRLSPTGGEDKVIVVENESLRPLEKNLVAASHWLYVLTQCSLFQFIWNELEGANDLQRLIPASIAWRDFYRRFNAEEITFLRMQTLAPFLYKRAERSYLSQTAESFQQHSDGTFTWTVVDRNKEWTKKIACKMKTWKHLSDAHKSINNIHRVLDCLDIFLKPSGVQSLKEVKEAAKDLETYFQTHSFDACKLFQLSDVEPFLQKLDPCLSSLNPQLLEGVVEAWELLLWLRELSDDTNFISSLEEAMGKSEMECPVELWQEEKGKLGRVDEQKLSMLNTVRGYLYELIYRPEDRLDLSQLTDILKELRPTDANVIHSLHTASEYRLPLMELLNDKSDNGAPDRLLQLLQPIRKAHWVCQSPKKQNKGELFLRWFAPRTHGQLLEKSQILSELMDFQSTIVLSKTDQRSEETIKASEKFIQQFIWIQQLFDSLMNLYLSGHFDYQEFEVIYSINEDPNTIRNESIRTLKLLEQWNADTEQVREKYYFLNFYHTKLFWRFINAAGELHASAHNLSAMSVMKDMLRLINPDLTNDETLLKQFVSDFIGSYGTLGETMGLTSKEKLARCGKALTVAAKDLPCRIRPVVVEKVETFVTGSDLFSGVNMICADDSASVYDHILSIYARAGYLPEREFVYICRENTTWSDVHTLLLRWAQSHQYQREKKVYCLGSVEHLSFELQRKVVAVIKHWCRTAENPLVVISGNAEHQHIVAQFTYCRAVVIPLPEEILREYTTQLSTKYSKGIFAVTADHAGAGKSFMIRTMAAKDDAEYVSIPVMHSEGFLPRLVDAVDEINSTKKFLLHFDLYDTVQLEFGPTLFDLIFIGGLYDATTATQFYWSPHQATLAFEIPAGSTVVQRLRICSLIPQRKVEITAQTFKSTYEDLLCGMGKEAFASPRNDGTCTNCLQNAANSYIRLQYVCTGLHIMKETQGRFPYVYEDNSMGQEVSSMSHIQALRNAVPTIKFNGDLPADRCFTLLVESLSMEVKKTSLWCVWNFINVFYWQLRDMHAPDSPINCACMPDSTDSKTVDTRAQIKGEVIQYLIRTAREFATRQVKQKNGNEIVGVFMNGHSRYDWNGFWDRMEFEHDGKPSFSKTMLYTGKFFLYYRNEEEGWVIDDIIVPSGPVFSRSEQGDDIDGRWLTSPDWTNNPQIIVRKVKDVRGYNAEAIEISGCIDDGGSTSTKENGIYIRQPPYDDIGLHPHYILKFSNDERRHLFWGPDDGWQVSPICSNDEGAFCMSVTHNIEGLWRSMPPDAEEDRLQIQFVRKEEEQRFRTLQPIPYQRADPRVRLVVNDRQTKNAHQEEEIDEEEQTMVSIWDNTLKWNDVNHESLLFSNDTHVVSFLSLNPAELRSRMHPGLLSHLLQNRINVGEDLDTLSSNFHQVLGTLTGVCKTPEEASEILEGNYCLTGDNLLKMLAIYARLRCGVPVVLMGECGCGKTMLLRFLCAWMNVELFVLDVHGGTQEQEIIEIFEDATKSIRNGSSKVFVFLDEINTCSHMGLICEIICNRSILGKRFLDEIHVLAALNPYRTRPNRTATPGLVYQLHGTTATPDPMSQLVYRVHPIPHTLRDFMFDFGALTPEKEKLYIQSMIRMRYPQEAASVHLFMASLIQESQEYVRKIEQEPSATSLRDVTRCLKLISWFNDVHFQAHEYDQLEVSQIACSTVLALAFVYYYRLETEEYREGYWNNLGEQNENIPWHTTKDLTEKGFIALKKAHAYENILCSVQQRFCDEVEVEDGIAMNQALKENLFVVIICILTRIPIFLVGKPGSSKTLTMQVIASNLQGKQSSRPFWRSYPAVYIFPYQCSPMSDSLSIQHQFDMAVRYQEHAENTTTILLLDEVGLAEHSPEMPLKVLHAMLVDPPIAIVGLSNWVLDPAKMNRAICLQRTEPSKNDITLTGQCIISSSTSLNEWLSPLARAYHEIYTEQHGRDFVGMRDYYHLIKYLRSDVMSSPDVQITPELLSIALCRNFGGKRELMNKVLTTFHGHCFGKTDHIALPPITQLIEGNLVDDSTRHLMLLTRNSAALSLMFGCGLLSERKTQVLIGSEFSDDKTELHLIQQINRIKLAMASGSTIVLLNHDNIYEALYDVLNQRYLYRKDQSGNVKKMLRLAIGSRSQLCQVVEGFKIVVIVEQNHAYNTLDLPLLNRFEKQVLCPDDVLTPKQSKIVAEMKQWVEAVYQECGVHSLQDVFCGYHEGTIPSGILMLSNFDDNQIPDDILDRMKMWMLRVARPIAMMNSKILQSYEAMDYFERHSDLCSVLDSYVYSKEDEGLGTACVILTHSPLSHLDHVIDVAQSKGEQAFRHPHSVLQLAELSSEQQLLTALHQYYQSPEDNDTLLLVQCDPIACSLSLINHARYICVKERSQFIHEAKQENTSTPKRHLAFLIHLPPGVRDRDRHFALDFTAPWKYAFIDDLRLEVPGKVLNTVTMLSHSAYDLVEMNLLSIENIIRSKFQLALSSCIVPALDNPVSHFNERIDLLRKLLSEVPLFLNLVKDCILAVLQRHKDCTRISDEETSGKVHLHVKMVCCDLVGGSLRQSLHLALEVFVVQAFAHVLRRFDSNFNLSTIWRNAPHSFDLWFALATCPTIIQPSMVALGASIETRSAVIEPETVQNMGKIEPMIARFPFSYRIIAVLDDPSTREQIDALGLDDKQSALINLCPTIFGEKIISLWDSFAKGSHDDYLHDYVAIAVMALPGLTFDDAFALYNHIIRVTRADCLISPASIHTTVWENEQRLFHCCSLLANNQIQKTLRETLLTAICSVPQAERNAEVSYLSRSRRLVEVDLIALETLFHSLWERIEIPVPHYSLQEWIREFSSLTSDVELYVLSLLSTLSPTRSITQRITSLQTSYLGLRIIHIFFTEVITELMLIGNDSPCSNWQKVVSLCRQSSMQELPFFLTLLETMFRGISPPNHNTVVSFVRRFIPEILFGSQEGYIDIGQKDLVSVELLRLLESILNGQVDQGESSSKFLVPLCNDLPLRRIILHCMLRTNEQGSVLHDFVFQISGEEAAQLYLQHYQDLCSHYSLLDWQQNHLLTQQDVANTNSSFTLNTNIRSSLQALAKAQTCLRTYAARITELLGDSSSGVTLSSLEFDTLRDLLHGKDAQVYCMKGLRNTGGIDCIGQLISAEEKLSWLPFKPENVTNDILSIPDPFPWLGAEYETVCGAVRSCATQSNKNTTQLDKIGAQFIEPSVLGAAIFTQTVLQRKSLFPPGLQVLEQWVQQFIEIKHVPHLQPLFTWLCNGCHGLDQFVDTNSLQGVCISQFIIHLVLWVIQVEQESYPWLYHMILDPNPTQQASFLPSVPDDPFLEIVNASGQVGWYVCPNGHKYSVGQCTMPMERAKCAQCGSSIGGLNHVSVKGNRKLNEGDLRGDPQKGYDIENNESECIRLTSLSCRVLRFFLHCIIILSSCITPSYDLTELGILSKSSQPKEEIAKRIQQDWTILTKMTSLPSVDLVLALHSILRVECHTLHLDTSKIIESTAIRNCEETKLSLQIENVLTNKQLREKLENIRDELKVAGETSAIRIATGEELWFEIHEHHLKIGEKASLPTLLWRYREPVSFQHFRRYCILHASELQNQFRLLKTFVEEEKRLQYIRGVADILAWHRIIFEVIPYRSITRIEAIDITNRDIINKLPAQRQVEAQKTFTNFARIFNKMLPTIDPLYECNHNPFIDKHKKVVDLGEGRIMDEDSSVAFSLPSMVTGSDGGDFVHGLCTIKILEALVDSQNDIVAAIQKSCVQKRRKGFKSFSSKVTNAASTPPQPAIAEHHREVPDVPAVNYLTPTEILQRQLIIYNRQHDLLPLLRVFAVQSLEYGEGGMLDYDLQTIQSAIANSVLSGKRAINLCIRHYQFKGDMKRMGHLENLPSKIQQESLPQNILDTICSEVDTQDRLARLMQQLEVCIGFVVSVGARNLNGNMTLSSYVTNTLYVSVSEWEEVSTPSIRQIVCLRHLQSLYLALEEMLYGNPLDDVQNIFCEPLPVVESNLLKQSAPKLSLDVLLPVFRSFLLAHLTKIGEVTPSADLKAYLGFASEQNNLLFDDEKWWEYFPSGIPLRFAKASYNLLKEFSFQ